MNSEDIVIVGGFHGRFSNETFYLNVKKNVLNKASSEISDNIFPFQVPTVADLATGSIYTVDWQTYKIYELKNNQWSFKKRVRG